MHTLSAKLQALPEQVRAGLNVSPAAADWLKVLALLAMLVDHMNTLLLPHLQPELYALGRMAFPLFVLIWARNVLHNPHRLQTRANRMWLWAIVTQPVFSFAFAGHEPWYALNILFVFAGATQLLAWTHRFRVRGLAAGLVLLGLMVWPLSFASYGLSGLVLALSLATFLHSPPGRLSGAAALLAIIALLAINSQHVTQAPAVVVILSILPTSSADSRCRSGPHNDRRPRTSIHAGNVLLHGLCRSSLYSWADNPAMLALDAELNVRMRRYNRNDRHV
ncbi:TraX family protein [Kosakonia cowanii]|uniref:TraX family protein n=1 Tax=Kosakonia cowanii TaxID=208223 RepID=UPI0039B79314